MRLVVPGSPIFRDILKRVNFEVEVEGRVGLLRLAGQQGGVPPRPGVGDLIRLARVVYAGDPVVKEEERRVVSSGVSL